MPALARTPTTKQDAKTKEDKKREKKEREAAEKAAKMAEKETQKQAKEAEKEREKQLKEDEKKRRDDQLKRLQAHRLEQEELQKVLDESKKTAAKEDQARKKETNGNGTVGGMAGILDRSKRGSKSMSKKSFSFFHKDKGGADATTEGSESGELPEKQEKKGRLSMGLGRKKSSGLLS